MRQSGLRRARTLGTAFGIDYPLSTTSYIRSEGERIPPRLRILGTMSDDLDACHEGNVGGHIPWPHYFCLIPIFTGAATYLQGGASSIKLFL